MPLERKGWRRKEETKLQGRPYQFTQDISDVKHSTPTSTIDEERGCFLILKGASSAKRRKDWEKGRSNAHTASSYGDVTDLHRGTGRFPNLSATEVLEGCHAECPMHKNE